MNQDFTISNPKRLQRQTVQFNGSLAGNAGATTVGRIPILAGLLVYFEAIIKLAAGDTRQLAIESVSAGADTVTITAHGLVTGSPVYVGFLAGGAVPAGLTALTLYYVNAVDANTLKFYTTKANAVTGSGTGLLDITGAGTTPVVIGTVEQAMYHVRGVCRNRNTVTALLGAIVQGLVVEDVAAWDATAVADDANDALALQVTPDATLATRYDIVVEFLTDGNNA
jgi:hypothetical protein